MSKGHHVFASGSQCCSSQGPPPLTLMLLLLQMAQHRWISREPLSFKMRSYEALTHPLQSCQSTDLGAKAAHASCETLATLHCNDGNESRESHGPVTIAAENKHGRKSCLYQSSFPALLWNQATALPSTQPGPAVSAGVCAANAASQVWKCAAPTDYRKRTHFLPQGEIT